jgi:hypothetical protein
MSIMKKYLARQVLKAAADTQTQQDHLDAAHDAVVKAGASCDSNPPDVKAAAGRRNSEEDQAALDDAHDHLVLGGASCDPMDDSDEDENEDRNLSAARAAQAPYVAPDSYVAGRPKASLVTLSAAEREQLGGYADGIARMRAVQ